MGRWTLTESDIKHPNGLFHDCTLKWIGWSLNLAVKQHSHVNPRQVSTWAHVLRHYAGMLEKHWTVHGDMPANCSRQRSYPTNSCGCAKVGVRRLTRAVSRSDYDISKLLGDDLALSKVSQLTLPPLGTMKLLNCHGDLDSRVPPLIHSVWCGCQWRKKQKRKTLISP